jgi:signal transduction histidine kinase
MMRRISFIIIFLFAAFLAKAQETNIDSLKNELAISQSDTINLILAGKRADAYAEIYPDSAEQYGKTMLALSKKLNYKLEEVYALCEIGYAQLNMGNYPRSLQTLLSAITLAEDKSSEKNVLPSKYPANDEFINRSLTAAEQRITRLSRALQYMGILYVNSGNYEKAKYYYYTSIPLAEQVDNSHLLSITYSTLGRTFLALKKPDSALICLRLAYDNAAKVNYNRYIGSILLNMGRVYVAEGRTDSAKEYFKRGLAESIEHSYFRGVVASNLALADIYKQLGQPDSSLSHIQSGLPVAYFLNAPDLLLRSYKALADFYERKGNSDSIAKYQSLIIKINDSLFNTKQVQQFQNIDFDAQQRQQQIEAAKTDYQNKFRTYALLVGIGIVLLVALILWRNNLNKQRAYSLLIKQKQETDKQKAIVEQTLSELKSTQSQLIQSEKMASLGELTAGIAHEIENPLNFVNNFSEVNKELVDELQNELKTGNVENALSISNDIKENEEKINHHGKRADAIVKGMLQHSRTSTGQKEPTDINALADEYLRLSYHGLRAKDKSFTATLKTNFDESIGNINVIPQDIGRVLLNLYNNAFYAATEKSNQQPESYQPTVSVSTKKVNGKIEIRVKDNGKGIPQKVLDKIFQPFFTTKPTGQGTGLGLSLSYDIIKAHGGDIKVDTKEGEGAEFIIRLPVQR